MNTPSMDPRGSRSVKAIVSKMANGSSRQKAANSGIELIKACTNRVICSDFQRMEPLDDEVASMSQPGSAINNEVSRKYAVWRRGLLTISGLMLILAAALTLAQYKGVKEQIHESALEQTRAQVGIQSAQMSEQWNGWGSAPTVSEELIVQQAKTAAENQIQIIGGDNIEFIDGIQIFFLLSVIGGAVLCTMAANSWANPKRSRKLAIIGFLTIFLFPFLIALVPMSSMMDYDHLTNKAEVAQVKQMVKVLIGLPIALLIIPKAIAMFSGIIRSSIALKTMVPESALPGWTSAIVAPLYSVFVFVALALSIQMDPDPKLLLGIGCLMVSPLVYVLKFKTILAPCQPGEVSNIVGPVRMLGTLFALAGFVFIGLYVMDLPFFDFGTSVKLMVQMAGMILLMTVVAADVNLGLIAVQHRQVSATEAADTHRQLEDRFHLLSSDQLANYGDFGKALPVAPLQVTQRVKPAIVRNPAGI